MRGRSLLPLVVLPFGVLMASTAAILIRYAQQDGMSSMTIAAGRLVLAALILTPIAWWRAGAELRSLQRRDIWLGCGAGFFLTLHFATWTSSLEYTSVANSTVLVTTNPIWVGLASWLLLREQPARITIGGIVITLLGATLVLLSGLGGNGTASGSNPLLGNILALVGAINVSGYFLIGRGLRQRVSVLAYIWVVYSSGAVLLLLWVLLAQQPVWGFAFTTYLLLLALAVGPQLLGHTSFNWALAHLSATFVALAILAEPIGSAIWAWFLFDERIDPTRPEGLIQVAGFVLLLVGIFVASRGERSVPPAGVDGVPLAVPPAPADPPDQHNPHVRP